MALDATVGGANANSFMTRARADALAADMLYIAGWTAASSAQKDQALVSATQQITAVTCWTGGVATGTQALPWPRTGMVNRNGAAIANDVIPLELEMATLAAANLLLTSGANIPGENEAAVQGLDRVKAGPIEVAFKDDIMPAPYREHPAAPYEHWSVLPVAVLQWLVPSWLCARPNGRLFEVL